MSTLPRYLTMDQVAELMQVRRSTVRRWVRTGELAAWRRGRNIVRVSERAVEGFLRRSEATACPPAGIEHVHD